MASVLRVPESCAYRQSQPEVTTSFSCELVTRILGRPAKEPTAVERTACEACCRQELPAGPRLNSVVAALVFNAATDQVSKPGHAQSAASQLADFQSERFAAQFLRVADRVSEPQPEAYLGDRQPHAVASDRCDPPKIGLVGPQLGYGLAHQNQDMANHLPIDRWLTPSHTHGLAEVPGAKLNCRVDRISRPLSNLELEAWLEGLDALIFVEHPTYPSLTQVARQMGVRVICVPNWEWLQPALPWLPNVDLMLCPTLHTHSMMQEWRARFSFAWQIAYVPWPIDGKRFPFRQRSVCQRFVYIHGSGGTVATNSRTQTRLHRKGLTSLLAAAQLCPRIPFTVYAPPDEVPVRLGNVEFRPRPADNRLLYCDGDVCVQPSHWEGLGLPLLECQAAGMPLITTNAAPMNEHHPWRVIPAEMQVVQLSDELQILAAIIDPQQLAEVLQSTFRRVIFFESRKARRFVTQQHSWSVAGPRLMSLIRQAIACQAPGTG